MTMNKTKLKFFNLDNFKEIAQRMIHLFILLFCVLLSAYISIIALLVFLQMEKKLLEYELTLLKEHAYILYTTLHAIDGIHKGKCIYLEDECIGRIANIIPYPDGNYLVEILIKDIYRIPVDSVISKTGIKIEIIPPCSLKSCKRFLNSGSFLKAKE